MCCLILFLNIVLYWFLCYLKVRLDAGFLKGWRLRGPQTCIFLFLFSNDKFFTKTDNLTPWWVWTPSSYLLPAISHLKLPFCFLNPCTRKLQEISNIFVSGYPLKLCCSSSWLGTFGHTVWPAIDVWSHGLIYLIHPKHIKCSDTECISQTGQV